jgi:hypothetical protein
MRGTKGYRIKSSRGQAIKALEHAKKRLDRPEGVRNQWGRKGRNGVTNKTLKEHFAEILQYHTLVEYPDGRQKERTIMDAILLKLTQKALDGELPAIELILNRYFGKEEQKVLLRLTHEEALKQLKRENIDGNIITMLEHRRDAENNIATNKTETYKTT